MKCYAILVVAVLLTLVTRGVSAQTAGEKIEIGAQFTSLTLFPPPREGFQPANVTEPGFGGRVTYNLTRRIGIDSEINFFPNKNIFQFLGERRALQGQFGVKIGKRRNKFGVFAKARPGFLSIGDVLFYEPGASFDTGFGFSIPNVRIARRTFLTADVGAVVEFYPSRRMIVRFDVGDTMVRYGKSFEPINFDPAHLTSVPARLKHNFQFIAGIGFHLRKPQSNPSAPRSTSTLLRKTPRYEVGVQFTSLSFDPPTPISGDAVFLGPDRIDTEPGFGGRFTFNLNSQLAVDAATNFFPREQTIYGGTGRLLQNQFGVKAGHRWHNFGLFGKIRPGLVSFTRVNNLVGTQIGLFDNRPFEFGLFRVGWRSYFSLDAGGVIETYLSRRFMTRIDIGDTIIKYNEFAVSGFSVSQAILRRPPETHHNFQFSAGVGWRF